jgi:hypothetical protein
LSQRRISARIGPGCLRRAGLSGKHILGALHCKRLPAFPLALLVKLPASRRARHHNHEDKNRDQWKTGLMVASARALPNVNVPCSSVLVGNQVDVRRVFSGGFQIVGKRLLFIDAYVPGIRANITFVEDAAGEPIELFLFQRSEQARPNLCGTGDLVE